MTMTKNDRSLEIKFEKKCQSFENRNADVVSLQRQNEVENVLPN